MAEEHRALEGSAPADEPVVPADGSVLLLITRERLDDADFDRLEAAAGKLTPDVRWARRAGRLALLVDSTPGSAAALATLAADPAVEYVLANPSREEISRVFSRRDLLTVALWGTGVMAAACLAAPVALFLRNPTQERAGRGEQLVGRVDSIPVGGAQSKVVDGEDILIIRRDEERFAALTATCTHSEVCLVEWDASRGQLVCPCHHGIYDLFGNVVSGPPPRPLERRDVVVRDGHLYIRRTAR
jgi:cytochrome b6-f complex iron-sulfur subunit